MEELSYHKGTIAVNIKENKYLIHGKIKENRKEISIIHRLINKLC
jgi:hypothetical protein